MGCGSSTAARYAHNAPKTHLEDSESTEDSGDFYYFTKHRAKSDSQLGKSPTKKSNNDKYARTETSDEIPEEAPVVVPRAYQPDYDPLACCGSLAVLPLDLIEEVADWLVSCLHFSHTCRWLWMSPLRLRHLTLMIDSPPFEFPPALLALLDHDIPSRPTTAQQEVTLPTGGLDYLEVSSDIERTHSNRSLMSSRQPDNNNNTTPRDGIPTNSHTATTTPPGKNNSGGSLTPNYRSNSTVGLASSPSTELPHNNSTDALSSHRSNSGLNNYTLSCQRRNSGLSNHSIPNNTNPYNTNPYNHNTGNTLGCPSVLPRSNSGINKSGSFTQRTSRNTSFNSRPSSAASSQLAKLTRDPYSLQSAPDGPLDVGKGSVVGPSHNGNSGGGCSRSRPSSAVWPADTSRPKSRSTTTHQHSFSRPSSRAASRKVREEFNTVTGGSYPLANNVRSLHITIVHDMTRHSAYSITSVVTGQRFKYLEVLNVFIQCCVELVTENFEQWIYREFIEPCLWCVLEIEMELPTNTYCTHYCQKCFRFVNGLKSEYRDFRMDCQKILLPEQKPVIAPQLDTLRMYTPRNIGPLLPGFPALKCLSIPMPLNSAEVMHVVSEGLVKLSNSKNSLASLELFLLGHGITEQDLISLNKVFPTFPTLETIRLVCNGIPTVDFWCTAVIPHYWRALKWIEFHKFDSVGLRKDTFTNLIATICKYCTRLVYLRLQVRIKDLSLMEAGLMRGCKDMRELEIDTRSPWSCEAKVNLLSLPEHLRVLRLNLSTSSQNDHLLNSMFCAVVTNINSVIVDENGQLNITTTSSTCEATTTTTPPHNPTANCPAEASTSNTNTTHLIPVDTTFPSLKRLMLNIHDNFDIRNPHKLFENISIYFPNLSHLCITCSMCSLVHAFIADGLSLLVHCENLTHLELNLTDNEDLRLIESKLVLPRKLLLLDIILCVPSLHSKHEPPPKTPITPKRLGFFRNSSYPRSPTTSSKSLQSVTTKQPTASEYLHEWCMDLLQHPTLEKLEVTFHEENQDGTDTDSSGASDTHKNSDEGDDEGSSFVVIPILQKKSNSKRSKEKGGQQDKNNKAESEKDRHKHYLEVMLECLQQLPAATKLTAVTVYLVGLPLPVETRNRVQKVVAHPGSHFTLEWRTSCDRLLWRAWD